MITFTIALEDLKNIEYWLDAMLDRQDDEDNRKELIHLLEVVRKPLL
jgi:hypothetical protein